MANKVKEKMPAELVPECDLRSRRSIVSWLCGQANVRYYDHESWAFCFDVKCRGIDLSFDNLAAALQRMGYGAEGAFDDAYWVTGAKEKYDENEEYLFDWGIEDARRSYRSDHRDADGRPEDDAFNTLWDGTEVDVRLSFYGRSGGWLVITDFQGHKLVGSLVEDEFEDWSMDHLRQLAEYVKFIERSVEHVESTVEECAAFTFFVNTCNDVQTSADRVKEWQGDQSGEHEFAGPEVACG